MKNALMSLVEDKARQRVQEACTAAKVNRQIPEFTIGDTVDVYLRFLEGEKERIQVYNGLHLHAWPWRHRHVHRAPHCSRRRRRAYFPA